MLKKRIIFISVFSFLLGTFLFSYSAFAQSLFCNGPVTGIASQTNINVKGSGTGAQGTSFDGETNKVNLAIASIALLNGSYNAGLTGLAPENSGYAACTSDREFVNDSNESSFNQIAYGGPIQGTTDYSLKTGATEDATEYALKGYVWNENLGFISMYCNDYNTDGINGNFNEGVSCGNYAYGVKVSLPDALGKRYLMGYGWNDMVGYINFYCYGGQDGFGHACGPQNYRVELAEVTTPEGQPQKYAMSGYAWSGGGLYVGFNNPQLTLATAVEVNPCTTEESLQDPVCVTINVPTVGAGIGSGEGVKIANGSDSYDVDIYLRDQYGVPFSVNDLSSAEFTFSWTDDVYFDQIAGTGKGDPTTLPSKKVKADFSSATQDPNNIGHYTFKNLITSKAPTSDGNVSAISSAAATTDPFANENFLFKGKKPTCTKDSETGSVSCTWATFNPIVYSSSLKLNSVGYKIVKSGSDAIPVTYNGIVYPNGQQNLSVPFKPLLSLEPFDAVDSYSSDVITAYRGVEVDLDADLKNAEGSNPYTAISGGKLTMEVHQEYPNDCVPLNFLFSDDSAKKEWSFDKGGLSNMDVSARANAGEGTYCEFFRPGIYSVVEYKIGTNTVKYYGNKLPRLDEGNVGNLSIVAHGNVYAQLAKTTSSQADPIMTSGDIMSNVVRDTIVNNVRTYLRGVNVTCLPIIGCTSKLTVKGEDSQQENIIYVKNKDEVSLSDYAGDLGSLSGGKILVDGRKVLIVENGNLFIDKNVEADLEGGDQLIIVVLRNADDKKNGEFGNSGNVYLDYRVKNLTASIIAEGSIFTYIPGYDDFNDYGEPENLQGFYNELVANGNQLHLQGSISSNNTIGGADAGEDYVIYRDGQKVASSGGEEQLIAQYYDLNYLRMYRLSLETCTTGYVNQQNRACVSYASVDPLHIYDTESVDNTKGDLVMDAAKRATFSDDATNEYNDNYPVYIDYTPLSSFLLKLK